MAAKGAVGNGLCRGVAEGKSSPNGPAPVAPRRAVIVLGCRSPAVVRQWLALFGGRGSLVPASGREGSLRLVRLCWRFNCRMNGKVFCLVMLGLGWCCSSEGWAVAAVARYRWWRL